MNHFAIARLIAQSSRDVTKVGAVITREDRIVSTGFNGFPRGLDDHAPERHERPAKYLWTIHAELNAILNAARDGVSVRGCDLYCTHPPCAQCAGAIVQAGISGVMWIEGDPGFMARLGESHTVARMVLREAKVEACEVSEERVNAWQM